MGMSDCPECWETPCVCGHDTAKMARARRKLTIEWALVRGLFLANLDNLFRDSFPFGNLPRVQSHILTHAYIVHALSKVDRELVKLVTTDTDGTTLEFTDRGTRFYHGDGCSVTTEVEGNGPGNVMHVVVEIGTSKPDETGGFCRHFDINLDFLEVYGDIKNIL